MRHITARMAWHDSAWNGAICEDPAANNYCTGSHSLLSDRLAREKCVATEQRKAGEKLDVMLPEYMPPCFWSSCAFSGKSTQALHRHPFANYKDKKHIWDTLPPNSVYTWPFRLSIVQSWNTQYGKYFPDLEDRISRYCARLNPGHSLVFLYLNYDNPVSGDDYKYALVGCARLSDVKLAGHFDFAESELQTIRSGDGMQNFPTLNWAIRLTHEGGGKAVRLPYQEYLAHIFANPADEEKLEEIRVLVDEPGLLPGFKYVSEQVTNDHALALLYKLRRAFKTTEQHGIVNVTNELDALDEYIAQTWAQRGLYPGLGAVVSVLADLAEGEPQIENFTGEQLVETLRSAYPDRDLLEVTFELLDRSGPPPESLSKHKCTLRDARFGLKDHKQLRPALQKLSLFALTPRQVARILFPDSDGPHAFGGRKVSAKEIAENPYLLAESYVPSTEREKENDRDLDRELRTDAPIDYFTVDIGMFPDKHYIEPHDNLQDLTVTGPERLRAFAIEALQRNEEKGHSFAPLQLLVEEAKAHPLFHRDKIVLSEDQMLSENHLEHFYHRLFVKEVEGAFFFYRQETKDAEELVARFVDARLKSPDLIAHLDWLDTYIEQEASKISQYVGNFDADNFKTERHRLMEGALKRGFYCITGRPGSGKTQALHRVLDHLEEKGETATVLAPTGKAALRLSSESKPDASWKAETMDRWIFRCGLGDYLRGTRTLKNMERSDRYQPTDNLVIDEMSMVDLPHLALIFRALEVHQPGTLKRVILVGDENQLPPIGCGRPFQDIIAHVREHTEREKRHLVRLITNCRQEHDATVLDAAHLFAGKNRYHTELFNRLLQGGKISDYLEVRYWKNTQQLHEQVTNFIGSVLSAVDSDEDLTAEQRFNKVLGLYETGFVPNANTRELTLHRAQLLTPYRPGPGGSLRLSEFMRTQYRAKSWTNAPYRASAFAHSEKIICLRNHYFWNNRENRRELLLSNGSIGVICNHPPHKGGRKAYFPEKQHPLKWKKFDEDDFELAYGITVHKAQGSEFDEVIVVLPERRALLSRELVYTALTRSRTRLTLLVQETERTNPVKFARERSVLLLRNSSIFSEPFDAQRILEPEEGVKVKSKIEYLIYRELQSARIEGKLTFAYEETLTLPIDGKSITVRPDFTIRVGGKTFYWEHLGMLDRVDYSQDWQARFAGYKEAGLADKLVTTDDLGGVRHNKLQEVVGGILAGEIGGDPQNAFSWHHYSL